MVALKASISVLYSVQEPLMDHMATDPHLKIFCARDKICVVKMVKIVTRCELVN